MSTPPPTPPPRREKKRCANHANHTACPSGYLPFFDWAEKMSKTHKQTKCKDCGLWVIWVPKKELKYFHGSKAESELYPSREAAEEQKQ